MTSLADVASVFTHLCVRSLARRVKARLHVRQTVRWVGKCCCNPAYVGNRAPQDAHPCIFMTGVIRKSNENVVLYI